MTARPAREEGLAPSRPAAPRVQLASAEPQIFGLITPVTAMVLGAALLVGGIAMLASGAAGGVALIAGAVGLLTLAIQAARRWPASRLPRLVSGVADGVGARLGLARASASAWTDASRRQAQLEREIRELREERRGRQADLGEAVYREEPGKVDRVRRRLTQLDRRISECERELGGVGDEALERVQRERAAAPATQPYAVAEAPPPVTEDEDTRAFPTEERPVASGED